MSSLLKLLKIWFLFLLLFPNIFIVSLPNNVADNLITQCQEIQGSFSLLYFYD